MGPFQDAAGGLGCLEPGDDSADLSDYLKTSSSVGRSEANEPTGQSLSPSVFTDKKYPRGGTAPWEILFLQLDLRYFQNQNPGAWVGLSFSEGP